MSKKHNYKIKKTSNIGSPDAETDQLLFDAFINIDNVDEIRDTKNQKSILIGRTGSGKSAILEYLKRKEENIVEIAPEEMSLRFLSNSNIISHFKKLDINLHLFYKVLWKHVFVVELLKLYFDLHSEEKKKTFFESLREKISSKNKNKNAKKERALTYMKTWTNDFWEQTEYRIKSFEEKIEKNFASSIGVDLKGISGKIDGAFNKQDTTFIELKKKAETVIHNSQVVEIIDVLSIMREELFTCHQKKFYIIIDDLDKEWIEDEMRYELIGAMIEVIKEFRKLQGVKIVISLRENLNELVFSGIKNRGGQREKFKPLFSNLTWTNDELKKLINKRIKIISDNKLDIKNAFYEERYGKRDGIDYVLERTFFRPRDVISYINHAIENANNKSYFTKDILFKAESTYSIDRFHALEDEWSENFGQINILCEFLRGKNNGFKLKSLNQDDFYNVYLDEDYRSIFKGELLISIESWKDEQIHFTSFLKKIIFICYRIGIIGVKKGPTYPVAYYYNNDVIIGRNDISNNSKFYIHPSLFSYFKINTMDQLPVEK